MTLEQRIQAVISSLKHKVGAMDEGITDPIFREILSGLKADIEEDIRRLEDLCGSSDELPP